MFAKVDHGRIINTDFVAYIQTHEQSSNTMLYLFKSESGHDLGQLTVGENDHQKRNIVNAILNNGTSS